MKKIKLIEVTSELGAGTRGASLGVGAIKTASFNQGYSIFSDYKSIEVKNFNEFIFTPNETPYAIRIEHIEKQYGEIINTLNSVFSQQDFPFVLAGDHSTAAATLASIKESNPGKRIGVIWVDAHADLHSPYTSPTGNVHGMPLAIACGIDNKECENNQVPNSSIAYWENLKKQSKPFINTEDLVFIGVRDTESPEDYILKVKNIKNFTVDEVREKGGKKIASETLKRLEKCDVIYVSFDVDSMDPEEVSHGTGTPVKNGLNVDETTEILVSFANSPKLICFETVEVNPTLDEKKNKMAEATASIINKVLETISARI